MTVELLLVPYDSGHRAVRMGRGPLHLIEYGIEEAIRSAGHQTTTRLIDCDLQPPTETAVAFDLARSIAGAVADARAAGRFPVVLAGNCISALGTVAGLGAERTGVLWLDAHGDLNTPETTSSGFLDGMAAAALTGRCWTAMVAAVAGLAPVPDRRFALVGARSLDAPEEALLRDSGIALVTAAAARERGARDAVAPVVARMGRENDLDRFYLHVDLDVLDPEVARANAYASGGGLAVDDVVAIAGLAADAAGIAALAITAFDPAYDDQGRGSGAATRIVTRVLGQLA